MKRKKKLERALKQSNDLSLLYYKRYMAWFHAFIVLAVVIGAIVGGAIGAMIFTW